MARMLLSWFFLFFSICVRISRLLDSLVSSLKYMRKKENLGAHHHVIPWVLRFLTFLTSLYLSESSYVCSRCNFHVFSYT